MFLGYFILQELSVSIMQISLFFIPLHTVISTMTRFGAADDLYLLEELHTVHRLRVSFQKEKEKKL